MLWSIHLLIADAATPMVGASAGVFGVLLAAGAVAPGMTITLWFPPVTLEFAVSRGSWWLSPPLRCSITAGTPAAKPPT